MIIDRLDAAAKNWTGIGPGEARDLLIAARAEIARLQSERNALAKSWLCYHCNVRFTDGESASRHFGTATNDVPLCQADKMLIVIARKERDEYAEIRAALLTKIDALRAALKRIADLECRHAAAIINKDCGPCIADQALADEQSAGKP